MKSILIDDEPKAIETLEGLLAKYCPQVEIIGKANSVEEAYKKINFLEPELLFLDIDMPRESGFDLVRQLSPRTKIEIIFVTGHDEYAIQAMESCAIGYLLKPVLVEKLQMAVQAANLRILEKKENIRNTQLLENLMIDRLDKHKVGIPTEQGLEFVTVGQIIRCEAKKGCTLIVMENRKSIISSHNVGKYSSLLLKYGFKIAHRSHLVNRSHVLSYDRKGLLLMSDGKTIPVSKINRSVFINDFDRI